MSRFDKLFKDISKRARNPEATEFALTEMYKLLIKYIGEENEKVVASLNGSNVIRLQRINGAGNTLG